MSDVGTVRHDDTNLVRFIESRGIEARVITLDTPTPTVPDAARALGVEPGRIIKSLVFLAEGEPLLVVAAGETRISSKRLRDVLGVSRRKLRMATPDEALELTGFEVGAMPPFGHRRTLPTLIDSLTLDEGRLYGGGGTRSAMLELDYQTLLSVTGGRTAPLTMFEEDT